MIHCKRAYESAGTEDGVRVLVDRLWTRNCRKDELPIAEWLPEVFGAAAQPSGSKLPRHGFSGIFRSAVLGE
ncbi:DUF488 family protein, N3 subclade [Pseudomonas halotolerans]|uniref:DUF488 family protein, N3 subclade n=1 Tax=Pseudomonas halotolerans TaxID=3143552 RepID=UPI003D64AAAF